MSWGRNLRFFVSISRRKHACFLQYTSASLRLTLQKSINYIYSDVSCLDKIILALKTASAGEYHNNKLHKKTATFVIPPLCLCEPLARLCPAK